MIKENINRNTKEYKSIHSWLGYYYGPSMGCSVSNCTGESQKFERALKKGCVHERNINNYFDACQTCHTEYDGNPLKPIIQYSKDGIFIKTWKSIVHIESKMGIISEAVRNNLKGRSRSSGGFIWIYKEGNKPITPYHDRVSIPVIQYSKNYVFIKKWKSATCAASRLEILQQGIVHNLKGRSKSAGGFVWKYAEEKNKNV